MAAIELDKPKQVLFVKNSGEFVIGYSKEDNEIIVTSEGSIFKSLEHKFNKIDIPDNHIVDVNSTTCEYSFEKLEKKIIVERNASSLFDHIMHEEIIGSIDAVDQSTDFGSKFISNHQVVLGGFEKAKEELIHI
jgi:hypothetical protein